MTSDKGDNYTQKTIKEIIRQGSTVKTKDEPWTELVERTGSSSEPPPNDPKSPGKDKTPDKQTPDINKDK